MTSLKQYLRETCQVFNFKPKAWNEEQIIKAVKAWLEQKRCSEEHLVVEGTHGLLSAHRNAIIDELLAMLEEA